MTTPPTEAQARQVPWLPVFYTLGVMAFATPLIAMNLRLLGWLPTSTSTLPTVIATTADCGILRGVDQGHRYYLADCRPDRLSRRGVME